MAELGRLGRYQLRRVLGRGAMGVVYEGFDPNLNRRVAVKTILKSIALDEETERAYSARFVREAQAVGRLNHPHIVQVHDFGEENEVAYLVMEFIQGRELRSFLDAKERFEPRETVRVMCELLEALDFAHEAGVIHRDVKPANIMLDGQRRVKLADFGVARLQDTAGATMDGTMVGTPAFMSPEQVKGMRVDGRTDIFSSGTILYLLLTGEAPFKGEGAWTLAKKIVQDDPPSPSSLVTNISPAFDDVIRNAMAKDPAQRYQKAREFAAALRDVLEEKVRAPVVAADAPKKTVLPADAVPKASDTELEFWRAIQNSNDPEEFEFYLRRFPDGVYSDLAKHKIGKLRAPAIANEAEKRAQHEAEEHAKHEAEARVRRAAEERADRAAAPEKARRDAKEREELKRQEEARGSAVAPPEGTTVGIDEAARPRNESTRRPAVVTAVIAAVVIAGGVAAYVLLGRAPAPEPIAAQKPAPQAVDLPKIEQAAPAPQKSEVASVDEEKIRRETEERVKREYADKAAAEKAAAEKGAAAEKAAQEKAATAKAMAEKAAAEKAAAEKLAAENAAAQKAQAERAAEAKKAAEKAAADKAMAEKAAAVKAAAADKAALEKAVAETAAREKAMAAKAAAQKAAVAKPGWPNPGDRWTYEARDAHQPDKKYDVVVEAKEVGTARIIDQFKFAGGATVESAHAPGAYLVGMAPGIAEFSPYLQAFQVLRAGERWPSAAVRNLPAISAEARIVGKEQVTVRAGTYDSWKVSALIKVSSGNVEFLYWFADDARRFVKYQSRTWGAAGRWTQPNVDMELVSYVAVGSR